MKGRVTFTVFRMAEDDWRAVVVGGTKTLEGSGKTSTEALEQARLKFQALASAEYGFEASIDVERRVLSADPLKQEESPQ